MQYYAIKTKSCFFAFFKKVKLFPGFNKLFVVHINKKYH